MALKVEVSQARDAWSRAPEQPQPIYPIQHNIASMVEPTIPDHPRCNTPAYTFVRSLSLRLVCVHRIFSITSGAGTFRPSGVTWQPRQHIARIRSCITINSLPPGAPKLPLSASFLSTYTPDSSPPRRSNCTGLTSSVPLRPFQVILSREVMSTATNGTTAAADPLASFPHISVGTTLGAWLVGSVAATVFLNGLLFQQMYQYFREYASDRRLLKVWVVAVVVLETIISALALHIAYFYLVQMYWDPTYFFLQKPVWSFSTLPATAPTAALLSQTFFVRRVWLFAPKFKAVVVIAFIMNVSNVGFFGGLSAKLFEAANFTDGLRFSWLAAVGSSMQMAGDIILSATLIYVLHQSRTGLNRTDSMLDVLIAYTISTGALNCVVHILNVAFSIAWPDNFIYSALSCILTKLYANSFLVALNTRKFLHNDLVTDESIRFRTFPAMRAGTSAANMPGPHATSTPTAIELKIVTEVNTEYDDSSSKGRHMQSMV